MTVKLFEVRDRATFISAIAIKLQTDSEAESYLISRAGFGKTTGEQSQYVLFGKLNGALQLNWDIFGWCNNRTMHNAHNYVRDNFDTLQSGAVIDVEFILGETDSPKVSERLQ